MTRFYDLDEANAAIPEVRTILEALRDQRAELIRLRDEVLERTGGADAGAETAQAREKGSTTTDASTATDADLRVLRLRMQGVIDRMQAGVVRIDELGITLREIETGLIDFPALASGRQIWLCWRLGEDDVAWWHELSDGFSGRQELAELT
jgi:hypothetical protein